MVPGYERILSLRTEVQCPMLQQTDEASAGRSEPERRVRMAEAAQGLSLEMGQSAGRSTHDESLFHMAERIPEGTGRKRRVPVEEADSDGRV